MRWSWYPSVCRVELPRICSMWCPSSRCSSSFGFLCSWLNCFKVPRFFFFSAMVTREKPRNRMDNIANIGKMEICSKGCNCWDWLFLYLLLMIFPSIFSHVFWTSFVVKMSFGDFPFWPPLVVAVLRLRNASEKDSMATVNIRISTIHVMSWSLQISMFSIDISCHKCLHNVYTLKKVKTECMNWKHPDEWWSSFQPRPKKNLDRTSKAQELKAYPTS